MDFVENKYSKIYQKLITKEKHLEKLRSKNKTSLVSEGSRKILEARKNYNIKRILGKESVEYTLQGSGRYGSTIN